MTQYTIDTDVELPMPGTVSAIYPFAEMLVGNSFFVPFGDEGAKLVEGRIRGAVLRFVTANGGTVRFTVRKAEQAGAPGVRVWRVA